MFKKILLIIAMITLVGCNTTKSGIVTTKKKDTEQTRAPRNSASPSTGMNSELIDRYISRYKEIAMSNMKNFGIPASITLAQGILESGAGQSKLAATANNHFGIKCYKDWTGAATYHDDDASQECFRKYSNPEESYQDQAAIVSKRSRYASLFKLPKGDYKGWAIGLKAAGYATDPKYPDKLINYIEQYHLDQYDNQVLGKKYVLDKNQNEQSTPKEMDNITPANGYEVQQGDTLYSISKKFNISIEEIKKQNNISDNSISTGQTLLIK